MRHLALMAMVLVLGGSAALAQPRPVARPQPDRAAPSLSAAPQLARPVPRPVQTTGLARSLRPQTRAPGLRPGTSAKAFARKGSVCGVSGIRGQALSAIPGRLRGCGVTRPVKVTSIDGVVLSMPSTMDCTTAKALQRWIKTGARRSVGNYGGGVYGLRVVAHYACRTRNNQPGAKISEHGRGRAIDIAGIRLKNRDELSVLKDWGRGKRGRMLRQMHRAACGPFGTVLGPQANRFHRDHFHFDTARYRSGPYCR